MTEKKASTKTGKKGGTSFPRVGLEKALEYAKKLVSKTHTGPQPQEIIYPGVFDVKGTTGNVRVAALRHYGLLEGTKTTGFSASAFAKKLVAAPPAERTDLLRKAAICPKVFGIVYSTFQDDSVSRAKIRQQIANQKVHPDHLETCTDLCIGSLVFAGLATEVGDDYRISSLEEAGKGSSDETDALAANGGSEEQAPENNSDDGENAEEGGNGMPDGGSPGTNSIGSAVNVTLTVDSSMDPEKLERQLKLLKKYGAL